MNENSVRLPAKKPSLLRRFGAGVAFPYALIAGSVNLHELGHAAAAKALGIPVYGIKIDPALGGKLMEYLNPLFSDTGPMTHAQTVASQSHFNQAIVGAAPNIFGFASGAALMAYGLRKKNPHVFKVGVVQSVMTGQYAAGELLKPLGDFSAVGHHLMAAAHKHLDLVNPAAFHDTRWSSLVGVAAVAGTAWAAYRLPSFAARSVARMRQKWLERKKRAAGV